MQQQILHYTGFKAGEFPLRYLGVPMSPKKWSKSDCFQLILKMSDRIDCWTSKKLSYAGRLELVRSVLNTLHTYWASIFLLPASILKELDQKCRTYLWGQKATGKYMALVNWERVCTSKDSGGLGIHESKLWNLAAMGKQIWNLAMKRDSLWIRWIDGIYLKGADIWSYVPPQQTNWHWSKLLKMRDLLMPAMCNNTWTRASDGLYSVNSGYNWLKGEATPFPMSNAIWNKLNVPKHSFCLWLVAHGRLPTLDRLHRWSLNRDSLQCVLCNSTQETIAHLYFQCPYSRNVLVSASAWLGLRPPPTRHVDLDSLVGAL